VGFIKYFLILFLIFLSSCYKNHLYVQHEKMDISYLASTYIGSPDFRQKHPPEGQRISIAWDFPISVFREHLNLVLTVRFWDNNQSVFVYKIPRKRGYTFYKFQDDSENKDKKILTYKVDIVNEDGSVVETWKHQFWKELIEINKDENLKDEKEQKPDEFENEEIKINSDEAQVY
jgi:hypothetical protein